MPVPIHEYNSRSQDRPLGTAWRRCTYPFHALTPAVAAFIRPNGEIPLSWADLSSFDGAERLEGDVWTNTGYWLTPDEFQPLREAHGVHIGPLNFRPPNKARGFPVVRGGRTLAVAWDDARIQLDLTLEAIELEDADFFLEILMTACAYLVDLYLLNATKRRLIHLAWEPLGALLHLEYVLAGSFGYWRRASSMFAAAFIQQFTDLNVLTTTSARPALLSSVEEFTVPTTLIDPREWSLHWPLGR